MDDLKPAVALNIYIEPYFRKEILHRIFEHIGELPSENRRKLIADVKERVRISGFRNPMVAPRALLVRDSETAFEKDTQFCLTCLKCWESLYANWKDSLTKILVDLGFSISEAASQDYPDALNTFLVGWPEGLHFDTLNEKILAQSKDLPLSKDEIALLSVLLTGYMP